MTVPIYPLPPSPLPLSILLLHATLGLRTDKAISLCRATVEEAAHDVTLSETANGVL